MPQPVTVAEPVSPPEAGRPAPAGSSRPSRRGPTVRTLVVLIAGAAIALLAVLVVGRPHGPVTQADIEHVIAQRPTGHVQSVFCNQQIVPTRNPSQDPPDNWTCDTYIGRTLAQAQNGPSYQVLVQDGRIASIRRVPVH